MPRYHIGTLIGGRIVENISNGRKLKKRKNKCLFWGYSGIVVRKKDMANKPVKMYFLTGCRSVSMADY